jgi:hypothetical protein
MEMTTGFPTSKRWFIKIGNREDFDKIADWDLAALADENVEIGYSDMILIYDTWEDKEGTLGCIIMNHFKDFEDGEF